MEDLIPMNGEDKVSDKKYLIAICLAGIFGIFGVHHFYLERWGMALFDLTLTVLAFAFLLMEHPIGLVLMGIDFLHTFFITFRLIIGKYKDGYGKYVTYNN